MQIHMIGRTYSPTSVFPLHSHDYWELVLHQSGTGITSIGDQTIPFSPGCITICPPKLKHSKHVNTGFFEDIFIQFSGIPSIEDTNISIFYDVDKKIETLLLMIISVYYQKKPGWDEVCSSILLIITRILYYQSFNTKVVDNVQLLQNEIIQNFTNPEFQLATVMDKIPYNKDYLRRCFKKELGINPLEYLLQMRMNYGRTLLQNNKNYSIKEVAFMSGYYDAGYFSRLYQKYFNINPSKEFLLSK